MVKTRINFAGLSIYQYFMSWKNIKENKRNEWNERRYDRNVAK